MLVPWIAEYVILQKSALEESIKNKRQGKKDS